MQNRRQLNKSIFIKIILPTILPTLLYIFFRSFPDVDFTWRSSVGHFYVVTFTSLVSFVCASFIFVVIGRDRTEALFLTLAFAAMAATFFVHGISTPGIVFEANFLAVGWAARLSLTIGAILLVFALRQYTNAQSKWLLENRYTIALIVLLVLIFNSWLLITEQPIAQSIADAQSANLVIAVFTVGLLLFSIDRAWQLYVKTSDNVYVVLILSSFWLILAQISQYDAPAWQFSWWLYHIFMLAAYLLSMLYLIRNYEGAPEFRLTRYFVSLSLILGLPAIFMIAEASVNLTEEKLRWTFLGMFSLAFVLLIIAIYALVYRAQWILNKRREIIEQEKQWRTDMTNLLAHDLMSPLNSIILNSDMVTKLAQDNSQIIKQVTRIRQNSETMASLLFDMLNIERFEAGSLQLEKEQINLNSLVNETVSKLMSIAEYRRITVETSLPDTDVTMTGDQKIMGRMIQNLVDNALKFAPQGGKIGIQLMNDTGNIRLAVSDNGPGITKDQRKLIFDKFGQLRDSDGKQGFGLGLAFCKLAVEAHDGTIKVEDNPGGGTIFTVDLSS